MLSLDDLPKAEREEERVAIESPKISVATRSVGTGRMGFAMASRLASAGNDVAVWNRTRAKAEPLTSSGAAIVDQISDLADRDVVFTVVGNSEDFEDVTTGPSGLLSCSGKAPRIIVDHSTVSVEASTRVAAAASKRGCRLLCAPVSRNAHVVAAGMASLMVSGPRAALRRSSRTCSRWCRSDLPW